MSKKHLIKQYDNYPIDYIDQSSASRFTSCPASYFFERLVGLILPDRSMIAPDYGTVFHLVAPMCYGAKNASDESMLLDRAMCMFEQEWNKLSYDPSDKKHNMDRTRERLQNFIELHAEGVCPYDIVKFPFATPEGADVISDNEVPFAIDIGANLPFLGRIDLPARCRQTNDLWANDYKTASEISSRLWECFELNIQAIGYTIALSQLSGEKCTGFMVEAIRKSATKNKTECAIHYEYIDDYRIELFLDYMSNLVLKLQNYQYNKEWPKRLSSCSTYSTTGIPGGHCPYKLLCRAEDWRSEAKYYKRKKPFHPFSIKPEGVKE